MPRIKIESRKINNKVKIRQLINLGRSNEQIRKELKVTFRDIDVERINLKNR